MGISLVRSWVYLTWILCYNRNGIKGCTVGHFHCSLRDYVLQRALHVCTTPSLRPFSVEAPNPMCHHQMCLDLYPLQAVLMSGGASFTIQTQKRMRLLQRNTSYGGPYRPLVGSHFGHRQNEIHPSLRFSSPCLTKREKRRSTYVSLKSLFRIVS